MADNLTDSEERRLLDLSIPNTGTYLALFTVAPNDAGAGGTEVSSSGYARQAITCASAATDAQSNSTKANSADIVFPAALTAWGVIVAYAVMDAASGGTMRWYRVLSSSEQREIKALDSFRFAAGTLTFQLS